MEIAVEGIRETRPLDTLRNYKWLAILTEGEGGGGEEGGGEGGGQMDGLIFGYWLTFSAKELSQKMVASAGGC